MSGDRGKERFTLGTLRLRERIKDKKRISNIVKGDVGSKTIYSKAAIEEGEVIIVVKKD